MKLLAAILISASMVCGAQTINYQPPRLVLATSGTGLPPYATLSTASGIGPITSALPYFVPMCSSTGAPPYSQCDLNGGGGSTITCVTSGGIVFWNGSGFVCSAAGLAGQVFTSNGPGSAPTFQASGGGTGSALPALVATPTPPSTTFLQGLNNAKNAPVHIAIFGDSFTNSCQPADGGAGSGPLNCSNRWAEQLRIQAQSIYGSHGTGISPVIIATGALINNQAWSCTGSISTSNILGPWQNTDSTLVVLGPGASCTFHDIRPAFPSVGSTPIAWDTLNTYCATTASSVGLAVSIDSGAQTQTACSGTSGNTAHLVTLASTSSTSHSVTYTNTAGSGNAFLYAAEGVAGTTGVSVDLMGMGGGTAAAFGALPTTQLAFSDLNPPQATIFMDQTNDAAAGVVVGTFSTNVQNVITHEQALSTLPTVMLAIPPVDVVNNTHAMAPYTAVQVGLCSTNNLTCINIQDRGTTIGATATGWGTTYIPSGLWDLTGAAWPTGGMGVHPSDAGNFDEFQMIYAQLVNPAGGGCSSNCTVNTSLTVTDPAAATYNAKSTGNSSATTYNWVTPGVLPFQLIAFGTGNGAGLAGALGLFDGSAHFVWNTNASDDICGFTPISNVTACVGSTWSVLHTGAAAFASVAAANGFSGTKTAGSCVMTIVSGIITNVTGC